MSGKKVESSKKPYCVCRFGLDSIDSNCQKNWYKCLSAEGRNAFQLFAAGTTQSVCSYGVCVSPNQNIFRYIGGGDWEVPDQGYDIVNLKQQIFVEMKNKHNTMNSSSSQKTYMRMQNTLLKNESAVCMLVEVIAANSQNMPWVASMDGVRVAHEKIRRVSIDKFYEIVTGDQFAFKKLCEILPRVIEDVVASIQIAESSNTVLNELKKIDSNLLKSIYLMSFKKYQGFNEFAC